MFFRLLRNSQGPPLIMKAAVPHHKSSYQCRLGMGSVVVAAMDTMVAVVVVDTQLEVAVDLAFLEPLAYRGV